MSLSLFAAQYQYQCMENVKKDTYNNYSEYICKYMWMNLIFCKGLLFYQNSFSFNRSILFFELHLFILVQGILPVFL